MIVSSVRSRRTIEFKIVGDLESHEHLFVHGESRFGLFFFFSMQITRASTLPQDFELIILDVNCSFSLLQFLITFNGFLVENSHACGQDVILALEKFNGFFLLLDFGLSFFCLSRLAIHEQIG